MVMRRGFQISWKMTLAMMVTELNFSIHKLINYFELLTFYFKGCVLLLLTPILFVFSSDDWDCDISSTSMTTSLK